MGNNTSSSQKNNPLDQGSIPNKTEIIETYLSPEWEWQSNPDPWSTEELPEWTAYSPEQAEILERAFQEKKEAVSIGNYSINLTSLLQTHKEQTWKVRPVRRIHNSQRSLRFCSDLMSPRTFGRITYSGDPTIIEKWLKNRKFNFKIDEQGYNITDEKDMPELRKIVDLAIKGILVEGKLGKWEAFAKMITKRLQENFSQNPKLIFRDCIYAYTQENPFGGPSLYTIANRTLREIDYSKIETMGPFCYMLHFATKALSCEGSGVFSTGRVYRGLGLDENMFELYKKAWQRRLQISFHPFTSTSKDEKVARKFSNIGENQRKVLLIIENLGGAYVESLTACKGEQEVLLPASRGFEITEIQEGEVTIVSLKMVNTKLESMNLDGDLSSHTFLLSHSSFTELPPILQEWGNGKEIYFEISKEGANITPKNKSQKLNETVKLAAEGIRRFYEKKGPINEKLKGKEIAEQLMKTMKENPNEIFKTILRVYTNGSFLGSQINLLLKSESPEELKDLGAYAYLLNSFMIGVNKIFKSPSKNEIASSKLVKLYTMKKLKVFHINLLEELYRKNLHFAFNILLAASPEKNLIRRFVTSILTGDEKKVIFSISVPENMALAFDISPLSAFPNEREVMIPSNTSFRITNINLEANELGKNFIEIELEFIDYVI